MTVMTYPVGRTDPFAAILTIGDSWFWYPNNNLVASILALKKLHPDYKTANVLGKNGALLADYRAGKFASMWRNELSPQNFRFSLVLISGGGNDSVNYQFALKANCSGISEPAKCFDAEKLAQFVDEMTGTMAALVTDVQIAAMRAGIRTPPVLLNGYDRPVPDGRGFSPIGGEKFKFGGPWIKPAFDRAQIDPDIGFRTQVICVYINALNEAMQHLASRTSGVHCVSMGTDRTVPFDAMRLFKSCSAEVACCKRGARSAAKPRALQTTASASLTPSMASATFGNFTHSFSQTGRLGYGRSSACSRASARKAFKGRD